MQSMGIEPQPSHRILIGDKSASISVKLKHFKNINMRDITMNIALFVGSCIPDSNNSSCVLRHAVVASSSTFVVVVVASFTSL